VPLTRLLAHAAQCVAIDRRPVDAIPLGTRRSNHLETEPEIRIGRTAVPAQDIPLAE
jgi:hypothetical protein